MDEIIVLQTLYTLLVQNKTNRVSLVRLQTEINENALIRRLVPSTGKQVLSVHDILETIKQLFPKKTSLTDGQLTFYNLQLGEMRESLFELYDKLKVELMGQLSRTEPEIEASFDQGQDNITTHAAAGAVSRHVIEQIRRA